MKRTTDQLFDRMTLGKRATFPLAMTHRPSARLPESVVEPIQTLFIFYIYFLAEIGMTMRLDAPVCRTPSMPHYQTMSAAPS